MYHFGFPTRQAYPKASRPMQDETKTRHFNSHVKGDIEPLRKGEYKDCIDLMDFYEKRFENMPITVVPRPR